MTPLAGGQQDLSSLLSPVFCLLSSVSFFGNRIFRMQMQSHNFDAKLAILPHPHLEIAVKVDYVAATVATETVFSS